MARYLIGNVKGPQGLPGKDGVSPTAKVVQTDSGATLTVTDASGTTTAQIKNGESRSDYDLAVQNGFVGTPAEWLESLKAVTPYVTVEQSGDNAVITAIDANGTTTATVSAGGSYRAGAGIDITDGVISATDAIDIDLSGYATETYVNNMISEIETQIINPYVAGDGIAIGSDNNEISVDKTVVATKTDLAAKQDTLTAGENIRIENNVISAVGGGEGHTYTAGAGIDITNDEISVDNTVALKSELFSGDYNDLTNKPDLNDYVLNSDLARIAYSGDYGDLSGAPDLGSYVQSSDLATVATTGRYSDLTDKPQEIDFTGSGQFEINYGNQLWINPTGLASQFSDTQFEYNDHDAVIQLKSGLIPNYTAGTGIDITNNVISATSGSGSSYTWTDEVLEISGNLDATTLAPLIEKYQENKYYPVIHYGNLYYHFFCIYPMSSYDHLHYIALGLGFGGTGYQQWNMIDIQFKTSDKSFVKATTPTNRMPTDARGLKVQKAYSVTGAEASAADNFKYILDNYAKTTDLAAKQDALTAGTGITIENNVISASGGSSSINVDGVSIINDNGTYKTAIGGGTVVTPTVDYLSNASGTTTVAMNQSSNLTQTVNFSTGIPANATFDVTYTLINHSDNDATTTITTNFETWDNGNVLQCNSGGLGTLGYWIGCFWMTGSDFPWEGISSADFNGNFRTGDNVEVTGLTITANGITYLDNQTITFSNGIQPGSNSIVQLTSPINFSQTLVGPGYDDSDLIINLDGTVTIKDRSNSDAVVSSYSFTNEAYSIQAGQGAPVFYYDGGDLSQNDYSLESILCSVSSRDQETGSFSMSGIVGVRLNNGSTNPDYYAELSGLSFSLGGSQTQYINPDFLPLGDNLYVQDGRVHANGAPMYDGHLVIYDTNHQNGWYLTTDGNTITLNPCPWNN